MPCGPRYKKPAGSLLTTPIPAHYRNRPHNHPLNLPPATNPATHYTTHYRNPQPPQQRHLDPPTFDMPAPRARYIAALAAALAARTCAADTKPNVVLFMPDDLHHYWDDAPKHPTDDGYTDHGLFPNMEAIRNEGVVFTRSYVAGSKCAPSRFNLMTSRYCSGGVFPNADTKYSGTNANSAADAADADATRVQVTVPSCKLSGTDLTDNLPTTLAANGYETIMSGKWHLSESLNWDNSVYDDHVNAVKEAGFTNPASVYVENLKCDGGEDCINTYGFSHNMEWMVNTSLAAIDASVDAGNPFFLYFAPTLPHSGGGDAEDNLEFAPDTHTPSGILAESPGTEMRSREDLIVDAHTALDGVETAKRLDHYIGGMVVDDALGELVQHLKELGVLEDTIIIVTMDHGQLAKESLYEGGIRTSLMARYPPGIDGGLAVSTPVTNLDIGPTILEAAGLVYPSDDTSGVNGASWWPLATGADDKAETAVANRECIFTEINLERAATCGDYKYMSWWTSSSATNNHAEDYPDVGVEHQLYNIATDPSEENNLADMQAHADTLADMQQALRAFLQGTPATAFSSSSSSSSSSTTTSTSTTTTVAPTTGPACENKRKADFCIDANLHRCMNNNKFIKGCVAACDQYTDSCDARRARREDEVLGNPHRTRTVLIRGRAVTV